MANIRIFREQASNTVFVSRGLIGPWPVDCLKAIGDDGNVDNISIINLAKTYPDGSDFFEISDANWQLFVNESDVQWGTDRDSTVDALNALFSETGGSQPGQLPVITSALSITTPDDVPINYLLTADFGVGYEWGELPVGLAVASNNNRNLIGTIATGPNTYFVDMTAVNYYGSDTETLEIEVTGAGFSNSRSVLFSKNDFMEANAETSNPLYRPAEGSGASDAWTLSLWWGVGVALSTDQTLLYFGGGSGGEGQVSLVYDGTTKRIALVYGDNNDNLILSPFDSLVIDTYFHVMVTYDGGTTGVPGDEANSLSRFKIFIEGVEVTTENNVTGDGFAGEIVNDNFRIGKARQGDTLDGNTLIDEVALWNSDESANVASIYNGGQPGNLNILTNKPQHWWRMGDGDDYPIIDDNSLLFNLIMVMKNMTAANITNVVPPP